MKEKCINCPHPSKTCIAFLMTLTTKEMLEWCRYWKDKLKWSNSYLAEKSNVPKGTIDRLISLAKTNEVIPAGVKLDTIRPIICALIGCSIEELEICEVVNTDLAEKCERLSAQIAEAKEMIAIYREQNATYKKQIAALSKTVKDYEKRIAALEKQLKAL